MSIIVAPLNRKDARWMVRRGNLSDAIAATRVVLRGPNGEEIYRDEVNLGEWSNALYRAVQEDGWYIYPIPLS